MRTYTAKIQVFHESFGGYDHCDGYRKYTIEAKDHKSARNKLDKLARDYDTGVRWWKLVSLSENQRSN